MKRTGKILDRKFNTRLRTAKASLDVSASHLRWRNGRQVRFPKMPIIAQNSDSPTAVLPIPLTNFVADDPRRPGQEDHCCCSTGRPGCTKIVLSRSASSLLGPFSMTLRLWKSWPRSRPLLRAYSRRDYADPRRSGLKSRR